jgi:nickel-dependent lactate racemase
MIVKLPQCPWYGDTEFEIDFPTSWEVVVCQMAGWDAPKLSEEGIQSAFRNPIGTPRIKELARNKKEVVILFDDLSRPTKVAELVPYVLQELKEGGIKDENIRFIATLGDHRAMTLMDFTKKLGPEVVRRFPVYNHNPYEFCTSLGTTSRGTPVFINSEFMSCDLKIAIGAIVPHPGAGFGGGGKAILPGIAHTDTIWANHHTVARFIPDREGRVSPSSWGKVEDNALRLDAEETARMAGLDVIVNAVVNLHRDTVGLFVGDLVAAHREGVKLARQIYTTETPGGADIVIANAYQKANEAALVVPPGNRLLRKEGGDFVIIANIPEGQICHYLTRSFGKEIGGRCWKPIKKLPSRTKRMIVLGTYMDRAGLDWVGPPELITLADSWSEILDMLKMSHDDGAKVVVVPDATIQHFPALWGEVNVCT